MNSNRGFTLLYIMIVLASIVVALSLAAGTQGAFAGNRIRSYQGGAELRMVLMQCAETLLMQVRNSPTTSSSGTLTNIQGGSCTYAIAGTIPSKTITITATKGNGYRRMVITISAVSPLIVATWVEGS